MAVIVMWLESVLTVLFSVSVMAWKKKWPLLKNIVNNDKSPGRTEMKGWKWIKILGFEGRHMYVQVSGLTLFSCVTSALFPCL